MTKIEQRNKSIKVSNKRHALLKKEAILNGMTLTNYIEMILDGHNC